MEKENKKEKRKYLIIVPLLLIIIFLLVYLIFSTKTKTKETDDLKISGIQIVQEKLSANKEISNRKTRILGDNLNTIDKNNPYVYLKNDSSNHVYLQFDVVENDKTIYSSNLIEPGMMEKLCVFDLLPKGKHKLEYHITSYDLDSKEVLLSGVKQIKDITIY